MLITNQCCARELQNRKLQGIYRIHEPPDVKDVTELRENEPDLFTRAPVSLQELSSARRSDSNLHEPGFRLYLHLVQKAKGNPAKINRILRSMQKAHYDSNPFGHWALNWQDYAHFTAPIRRYTDLWCHRELARSSAEAQQPRAHNVVELCDLISANEITIQKNERSALKVCAAWLLRERIGDEMTGTISGMEEWGVFVTLDDPPTDGLVRFRDLPGNDYWYFNREKSCVVGRRSRRTYFRGDKVVVQVLRVNPLKA
jgi:ribonuclease R